MVVHKYIAIKSIKRVYISIKPMLISPGSVFDLFSSAVPGNFRLKFICPGASRYIAITTARQMP